MSIELQPFSAVKAAQGAKVVTRNFREVEFMWFNPRLQEPVRVRARVEGKYTPFNYFESGRKLLEKETNDDLFLLVAPRKTKKAK
jgi:hypothetical protein